MHVTTQLAFASTQLATRWGIISQALSVQHGANNPVPADSRITGQMPFNPADCPFVSRVRIDVERQTLPRHGVGTRDRGLNPRGHSVIRHAHIAGDHRTNRWPRPTTSSIRQAMHSQADAFECRRVARRFPKMCLTNLLGRFAAWATWPAASNSPVVSGGLPDHPLARPPDLSL